MPWICWDKPVVQERICDVISFVLVTVPAAEVPVVLLAVGAPENHIESL